jgi:hypothetical protein
MANTTKLKKKILLLLGPVKNKFKCLCNQCYCTRAVGARQCQKGSFSICNEQNLEPVSNLTFSANKIKERVLTDSNGFDPDA